MPSARGRIFCDGACLGNPGVGAYAFVLSLNDRVTEAGEREDATTNNRMELLGAIKSLEQVEREDFSGDIDLFCDSKYVVEGIRFWVPKWKRNQWRTAANEAVKNQDLWERFDAVVSQLKQKGVHIHFSRVPGHQGIPGNERCDEIAQGLARGEKVSFYKGPLSTYSVDLLKVSFEEAPKGRKPYYLSVINGQIFRDETWSACEARVKGKRGVRYKKVSSPLEEQNVLKLWGVRAV